MSKLIINTARTLTNQQFRALSVFSEPIVTQYGGKYRVTLIHGDGIGPEMMTHVKEAYRYVRAPVIYEDVELNSSNCTQEKVEEAVLSVKRNGVALKGNVRTTPSDMNTFSVNVQLRQKLDLFSNVLRCKSIENVKTRHNNLDILIIRENTEGEYSNLEHESVPGVVESLKIITRERSLRIAEFAFQRAQADGRKKVTAVHKANIMKLGDGLFIESCKQIAKHYPDIKFETMIVDNTCMQLVSRPQQFDVMVMPNLYGNIVANVCTGLVGGAGIISGSNYGEHCAVFESGTRNSSMELETNKNTANPSGYLFASANLLKYIGLDQHSAVIKNAVINTISKRNVKTVDIGGTASTSEFMKHVLEEIQIHTPEIGIF
jgi:isocitrate dehydrogenase (NAD+)